GTNEFRCIIGDGGIYPSGKLRLKFWKSLAYIVDDIERVSRWGRIYADEDCLEAVKGRGRIDGLRAKLDIGYVGEPYQRVVARRYHQLSEGSSRIEGCFRINGGLNEVSFDLSRRGGEIIGGQRGRNIRWCHTARGHPVRIEPD